MFTYFSLRANPLTPSERVRAWHDIDAAANRWGGTASANTCEAFNAKEDNRGRSEEDLRKSVGEANLQHMCNSALYVLNACTFSLIYGLLAKF